MQQLAWEEYAKAEPFDTTFDRSFQIPYENETNEEPQPVIPNVKSFHTSSWKGMETLVVFFQGTLLQEEKYQVLADAKAYAKSIGMVDYVASHHSSKGIELVFGTKEQYIRNLRSM